MGHPHSLMSYIGMMSTLNAHNLSLDQPVSQETLSTGPSPPPRHRQGEEFLRGPIPLMWLTRAAELPGKTLAVSAAIWFKAGATKNRTVKLTGTLARKFSVGRKACSRCLRALERAGLVSVYRHPGRSPVVTILEAPHDCDAV